jgi:hypothetical protein
MRCYSCHEEYEYDDISGDSFICSECGTKNYVIGTRSMSYDSYYESYCESQESRRTEQSMYGSEDDDDFESDTSIFHERDD